MLRSTIMVGHHRRIPHPSSPMSETAHAAGIGPIQFDWKAGAARPTTDDADISDEDFCSHFVFFFNDEARTYPTQMNWYHTEHYGKSVVYRSEPATTVKSYVTTVQSYNLYRTLIMWCTTNILAYKQSMRKKKQVTMRKEHVWTQTNPNT